MCKHKHTCDQCVREEMAELEEKVEKLRKKLPPTVNIIKYVPYYPNMVTVPYYPTPQWISTPAYGNGISTPQYLGNAGGMSTLCRNVESTVLG